MSAPVTTLSDIIKLAHNQYGIRFQINQQQLVSFANMIQYIAYNKDLACFEEWNQIFILGQDVFLQTDVTYATPTDDDIGATVTGNTVGTVGKLLNYRTLNRINKWIIEPPDGGTAITLPDDEILTISGSSATGVICSGQDFEVSTGPYRVPSDAAGNPPFRKFIGVSTVTDRQIFHVPPNNSYDGFTDYGLMLDNQPGRRQNIPYRIEKMRNSIEVSLVTSTAPQILQTEEHCGPGGTTLNTSKLRWMYYKNPPSITSISDNDKLVIPEEYRYEILFKGISRLADTSTYGDMGSIRDMINPLCERFWEDMRTTYQQFGRGSDWVSHGDNWDWYGLGSTSGGHYNDRFDSFNNCWP